MRVMLNAGFDRYTGYGNDAVDMAIAMAREGIDVVPFPLGITPGLPAEFTDLLTRDPTGAFDVVLQYSPPFNLHPEDIAQFGRMCVGWTMWERTPLLPSDMQGHGWKSPRRRTRWWSRPDEPAEGPKDWLDLMVVTCHDNVTAFRALDDGLPYEVVPTGIDVARWPEIDRSTDDRPWTFAYVGTAVERKNLFAILDSWEMAQQLRPDFDAKLVLKLSDPGMHPAIAQRYKNVEVITALWSPEQILRLYSIVDVLVSASRGEGVNKPALEFMSTGGLVMATDWSGHRNWLHPDTAIALPGELTSRGEYSDFEVDREAMAHAFLSTWSDQPRARLMGARAASVVRSTYAWPHVIRRLMQAIWRHA